jgi:hypothetical protein
MSDTQKLILWIVLAVIVIAIVAWLLVRSSRRRQEEEQRRQARALRAQAAVREAAVTRAADRASVTQQIASEARADADESHARAQQALEEAKARAAEAEQKAAQAERLDREAQTHESTAGRVQSDRDDLLREADRVDPDVETDEQGQDVDALTTRDEHPAHRRAAAATVNGSAAGDEIPQSAERRSDRRAEGPAPVGETGAAPVHDDTTPASTWPGAVGVGSAAGAVAAGGISGAVFDDDEPDLADAENPFAPPRTHGLESGQSGGHGLHEGSTTQTRAEESRDDDVMRDADAGAGDPRGTRPVAPVQGEGAGERMDPSGPSGSGEPHGGIFASRPEFGDPTGSGHGTRAAGDDLSAPHQEEQTDDSDDDADWVNGPVDEDAIDQRPVDDVVDWINGPSDDESVTVDVPDEDPSNPDDLVAAAAAGGARAGQDAPSAPADEVIGRIPEQAHAARPEQDDALHGNQRSEEEQSNIETAGSDQSDDGGDDADWSVPDLSGTEGVADSRRDEDGAHLGHQSDSGSAFGTLRERRISSYEEVRDGGYGMGSAATIKDGAQPLGHAIKGVRGSGTYLTPGSQGYDDAEPDVWFYDEQSARKAGYRPASDS